MSELQFPYMAWALTRSFLSPWCLAQSGMPVPDEGFLEGLPVDLAFATAEALPALERRLAELYGVAPERVLVTPGGSAAMLLCALRWFRAPARVVSELPSYEPLRALPSYLGAETALLRRTPEAGWHADPEQAEALLAGARGPGHVFLTNPHNPSGIADDAETLRALAAAAGRAGGVLVSCEAYMEFAPPARRLHAFDLAPNALSIGTLTKAYGLQPLRVGWIALGEGLAGERAALEDLARLCYVTPATVTLQAARRALDRLAELILPLRRVERESRPHWERWLRECPLVECVVPDYGILAFPRVVGVDDTFALARHLQERWQVDVVPGEYFGRAGHLRVCCGVPEQTLIEGLERLERGIADFRERVASPRAGC